MVWQGSHPRALVTCDDRPRTGVGSAHRFGERIAQWHPNV